MLFKVGGRHIILPALATITVAVIFSLAGCITVTPTGTPDNSGSTGTDAAPPQGEKLATLSGVQLGSNTGKVAINAMMDNKSSLVSSSSRGNGIKGMSDTWNGVLGVASATGTGVAGSSDLGVGVYGATNQWSGKGVYGECLYSKNVGMLGTGTTGVYGESTDGRAVAGKTSFGKAIEGVAGAQGYAGYFQGKVHIDGTLTKSAGSFLIDHPLDPENKYLSHSFVESPDMMNVYNGNTFLNENGEAVVELPPYFEALNRDFRYQLTCIGSYAPVYVAEKVKDNSFKIAGGKAGMEVSWQVTGIRQDPYAKAHPIIVEEEKPANEKGLYLNPVEWGQPIAKGIDQLPKP